MRSWHRAWVLGIAAALLLPNLGLAQEEDVGRRSLQLSRELMSPFCPGRTLADCPSPDATAVKDEIRAQLVAGRSEEEIREGLSARFGSALVGVPRSRLGWALPALLLGLGVGLLVFTLRRLSAPSPQPSAGVPKELETELDRELKARDLD